MPPAREIPDCYEEGPDRKVRCKVCRNAKWVAFKHVKEHLSSTKHRQAVEESQVREAGRADIEQRLGVVVAEQGNARSALTLANLRLPSFQPVSVQGMPSEAEKSMWQEYSKYDADFSAGDEVSEEDARKTFEQELDIMGIWDAVSLGQQLDGELDEPPNPAAEDDALLAEVLAALDASDPFDATEAQPDAIKAAEWHPYPSKTMLLLDICDNLPRLPVSESAVANDVPSLDALRMTQKKLRAQCGVPTISCTSIQGKNFCINDPKAIIRMECANPDIRSQMHFYPEVNTNGLVSEIWHGAKLCQELDPELLTPMFDAGHGTHYYVNELAQLINGCLVIHVRWIKVDGKMHADNTAEVNTNISRVSASLFVSNLLDLDFTNRIPEWSKAAIDDGYKRRMPNPLRSIAKVCPARTSDHVHQPRRFASLSMSSMTAPPAHVHQLASGPTLQERQETQLEESFIEHDTQVRRFVVNTASLHNPHLLRRILPAVLIKPSPLWDDRRTSREGRDARKVKNAAAAATRKALAPGTSIATPKRNQTATGSKRKRTARGLQRGVSQLKRASGIQPKLTWAPAERSRNWYSWNLAEPWMVSMNRICRYPDQPSSWVRPGNHLEYLFRIKGQVTTPTLPQVHTSMPVLDHTGGKKQHI
ncbi:hypothetical protein B0H14DRAFT_2578096 [Mycena olivaceomarginata]|nr:hypothetical protein B0H14DRAFT_2578096 [Mycena olivaceomarginata]